VRNVYDTSVGFKIVEEVSQGSSSSRCDRSNKEVCRRHTDELGDVLSQRILDILQGSSRHGNRFPLCMVVNIDSISGLEGAGQHIVSISDEQTMFGSKIC